MRQLQGFLFVVVSIMAIGECTALAEDRIGAILPLTGPLAGYGTAIKNGFELARIDNPDLFADCNIILEDSAYDPTTAVGAFRKLRDQDRVSLVYNFGGPTSEAIAPIAERAKLPTLLWTTDAKVVKGKSFTIRFANHADEFGAALAEHFRSRNVKRIGIVVTENQYLRSMLGGVERALSSDQSLTVIDAVLPETTDFRSMVGKVGRHSYDAVGVFLLSGQVGQFYRQMKEQRVSVATFGTDFFEDSNEIASAAGQMEGAVFANNEVDASFGARYIERYGDDVQLTYAGNGYDFAMLACESVKGMRTPEAIVSALGSQRARRGMLGAYRYVEGEDGDRYFKFPIVLKAIEGDTFRTFSTDALQNVERLSEGEHRLRNSPTCVAGR